MTEKPAGVVGRAFRDMQAILGDRCRSHEQSSEHSDDLRHRIKVPERRS